MKPILIETTGLILKGFSSEAITFIFENYTKVEIMDILGHRTEEEFQKEAFKQKNGYVAYNRSFMLFLLTEKVSKSIIGRCGFHNWNVEHKRAEIGYTISDENYKRKGFMTEAVSATIDYGFATLKLHRIEALVGIGNLPSLKLLKKQGFIREGLLRQHYYTGKIHEDSILFSLLKGEHINGLNDKTSPNKDGASHLK